MATAVKTKPKTTTKSKPKAPKKKPRFCLGFSMCCCIYKPNSVLYKEPLSFIYVHCYQYTLAAYPPTIERAALKRWYT